MISSLGLSKIDARIKRLEGWKIVLSEMMQDEEGKQVLKEVAASMNGSGASVGQRRLVIPPPTQTKKARLDAAIVEAIRSFDTPFSTRQLLEVLEDKGFPFSRDDRMIEIGAAMRRLLGQKKVRIAQEKVGSMGRLYEKVLQ